MKASRKTCMVGLVVVFTVVGATQLHFLLLHVTSQPHPCDEVKGIAIVRDPTNCSRYVFCLVGQGLDMPPCPFGHVWSIGNVRCVPISSPWNDCPDNTEAAAGPGTALAINNKNGTVMTSVAVDVSLVTEGLELRAELNRTTHLKEEFTVSDWSAINPTHNSGIDAYTFRHPCTTTTTTAITTNNNNNNNHHHTLLPDPQACHRYYNCSILTLSPEDLPRDRIVQQQQQQQLTNTTNPTLECPYPKLFSLTTHSCVHYTQVDCGHRTEYKTPCDYYANCDNKAGCKECPSRLAGCLGLRDGLHPFPSREWSPWYIVCKDERTLEQTTCKPPTPTFSPYTRECVTSTWVPKQHGGRQPLCYGRHNGLHPDERGACNEFFRCQHGRFLDYFICNPGLFFDPETHACTSTLRTPPCGNHIISSHILEGFCRGLKDGFHADPYGRCSLYIECLDQRLKTYLKCLNGSSFDPETKVCRVSPSLPAPCGFQTNYCQSKEDGAYSSPTCCKAVVTCRRGFVSSVDQCPNNEVFDDRTKSCRPEIVGSGLSRCGNVLDCQ